MGGAAALAARPRPAGRGGLRAPERPRRTRRRRRRGRDRGRRRCPPTGWAGGVLDDLDRFARPRRGQRSRRRDAARRPRSAPSSPERAGAPVVVDADGLTRARRRAWRSSCGPATVLTPHDGEFARARRRPPGRRPARGGAGPRRPDSARSCCSRGRPRSSPTPTGRALVGDRRVTPASPPPAPVTCSPGSSARCWPRASSRADAAAAGAFLHGRAGALGWRQRSGGRRPARTVVPAVLDRGRCAATLTRLHRPEDRCCRDLPVRR